MPELISVTVSSHPALVARQGQILAAESEVEAARWRYWPTPSVAYERADNAVTAGTDREITILSLKQPLWTGGRLKSGFEHAEAGRDAAEAALEETRRDIVLEVIQAYGEGYAAQGRVQAHETSLAVHDRLLAQVRRRAAEGLSTESDIMLAESRRDAVLAELALARVQADTAIVKLKTLVGRPLETSLIPPRVPLGGAGEGADVGIAQALEIDPTLARLKAESRELQAEADSSKSTLWPDVYARVDERYGDITGESTQFLIGLESKWGAGLSSTSTARAALQRKQAKQGDIDARVRELGEQVRSDYLLSRSAHTRVKVLQTALRAAREVSQSWDRQFLANKKSWQDVMNAAREVAQTEAQLAETRGAAIVLEWRFSVFTRGVEQVIRGQGSRNKG